MTTHGFQNAAADTAEVCTCGAAFFEGYHRHAMKVAHLAAFSPVSEVARTVVSTMTPGQVRDAADGALRFNQPQGMDLAIWNAAIDRENGYDD